MKKENSKSALKARKLVAIGTGLAATAALVQAGQSSDLAVAATTYTGDPYSNALGGQLEVAITVDAGKITAITTPITPSGRNASFASYAVPILTQEALAAQSSHIQAVSGASYISSAWISSLASAIAKAGSALTGGTTSPAPVTTPSQPANTPAPTASNAPAPMATPTLGTTGTNGNLSPRRGDDGGGDDGRISGYGQSQLGNLQQQVNAYIAKVNAYAKQIVDNAKAQAAAIIAKAQAAAAKIASPTPSASAPTSSPAASSTATPNLVLTPGSGVIMKSLICTKINLNPAAKKVTKLVKGLNPTCPKGYK